MILKQEEVNKVYKEDYQGIKREEIFHFLNLHIF